MLIGSYSKYFGSQMEVRAIRRLNEAEVSFDRKTIHAYQITDIINDNSFNNVDVVNELFKLGFK